MAVRKAAVAGTWYPAAAAELTRQVRLYVDQSETSEPGAIPRDADLVALIAPHAGLMYSGSVAAHSYRLLQSRHYDSVVLVGPSHYVGFDGASVWPAGAFETPLGRLAIDEDLSARIAAACPLVCDEPDAHQREHSLEMQLPFLAALAADTKIVPIVMGFQTRETAFSLGDALAESLRGTRTLLVASSDLSHFYDAHTAGALDGQVIARVDALDDEALMALLERRADHACGGGPMVSVMRAARLLGAARAATLRYADSGDISGDKSSVVGYLAAALWR
jgi:AmmeMemoRadiSam system protein B